MSLRRSLFRARLCYPNNLESSDLRTQAPVKCPKSSRSWPGPKGDRNRDEMQCLGSNKTKRSIYITFSNSLAYLNPTCKIFSAPIEYKAPIPPTLITTAGISGIPLSAVGDVDVGADGETRHVLHGKCSIHVEYTVSQDNELEACTI